jgi:ParB family chromosome partitioning protein
MARRRLAPFDDVPRAEQQAPLPRAAGTAPIARIAAEIAGAAALEKMAEALRDARESGRLVLDLPLEAIAPDHLVRDRLPAEDADMEALRESVRAHGQRTPVEVTPLQGALPYGLISGWRRLAALRALYAETGAPRFATVQALVRRPETAADAYVSMVEENEIRLGLSQYERARVAALAAERGVFPSEEDALRALFSTASRAKRSRIRAFLTLYHALDGVLRWPGHLPERLGLKLAELVRAGGAARIATALRAADPGTPEAELAALAALTAPARQWERPVTAEACLWPGVTLSQTLRGRTLVLRLTGEGVTPELDAKIQAALRALVPR